MCDRSRQSADGGQPFGLMQSSFSFLLAGNVANNLGRSHDPSRFIMQRRDGQRNEDSFTALSESDGFKMTDSFTARDRLQNSLLVVMQLRWNDRCDRPSDHLFRRVAEDSL